MRIMNLMIVSLDFTPSEIMPRSALSCSTVLAATGISNGVGSDPVRHFLLKMDISPL